MIDSTITLLPQARAGRIKAYAVTSRERIAAAPDIPTVVEAGLPGLTFAPWYGLFAPKGTPKPVLDKLYTAVVKALADPEVRQQFSEVGHEVPPRQEQTPEALGERVKADIEKWWPILKAAKLADQ